MNSIVGKLKNSSQYLVAEIVEGLPQHLGTFSSLDVVEEELRNLGYTMLEGCEWLADNDYGFDISTTFKNVDGVTKIICAQEQITEQ